jgi:hypothetical protein
MQAFSESLVYLARALIEKSLDYFPISIVLLLISSLLPTTEPEEQDDEASALADACEWLE